MDMISQELLKEILLHYSMNPWGIHGIAHWARVLQNGRRLALKETANLEMVELFAVLHDSQRRTDHRDEAHGLRAAEFAKGIRGNLIDLDDDNFQLLYKACALHTNGQQTDDVTIAVCWDSDRLDLGRVGIYPNPNLLCTNTGKESEMIGWAYQHSLELGIPNLVAGEWHLTPPIGREP
jgi:uncharacterized protein